MGIDVRRRTRSVGAAGAAIAFALLAPVLPAEARAQAPDPQRIVAQMQELQKRYAAIEAEREAERQALKDRICREELEAAKARAATATGPYDPYAAADSACNRRIEEHRARWKQEDAVLEEEKRAKLAEIMGLPEGMAAPGGMPVPPQP